MMLDRTLLRELGGWRPARRFVDAHVLDAVRRAGRHGLPHPRPGLPAPPHRHRPHLGPRPRLLPAARVPHRPLGRLRPERADGARHDAGRPAPGPPQRVAGPAAAGTGRPRDVDADACRSAWSIPAYDAGRLLPYVLAGLAAQTYPAHLLEVVVADDGPGELVLPEVRPERTRVVRVERGVGPRQRLPHRGAGGRGRRRPLVRRRHARRAARGRGAAALAPPARPRRRPGRQVVRRPRARARAHARRGARRRRPTTGSRRTSPGRTASRTPGSRRSTAAPTGSAPPAGTPCAPTPGRRRRCAATSTSSRAAWTPRLRLGEDIALGARLGATPARSSCPTPRPSAGTSATPT